MYSNTSQNQIDNIPDNNKEYPHNYSDNCFEFSNNLKKAKWTPETKKFFEKAGRDSLVLNIIISLSCKSQTGEAFEELVNALNEPELLSKIKKVNILDTTYLYRHFIPEFARYDNVSIPTDWYLSNKKFIEKIKSEVELKCWATEIDSEEYKNSFKKVMKEFQGDENGQGLIMSFRDTVIAEAATNAYKHKQNRQACVDFILEECAHLLASFGSGGIIVYPMRLYSAGDYMIASHRLDIKHLIYRVNKDEEDFKKERKADRDDFFLNKGISSAEITASDVESAVTNFMKNEVSNLNFFVVNKTGKLIYSNFALNKLIDKTQNANQIDENAWIRTYEVIRSGKMFVGEERGRKGRTYLSMKAPLRIEGEIHGAIGLSIDVTDTKRIATEKKRSMDLNFLSRQQQMKLKFQNEFAYFISQISDDISHNLSNLEIFANSYKNISDQQKNLLKKIICETKNISNKLFEKCKSSQNNLNFPKKHYILVALTLFTLINQKKSQYKKTNLKINFFYDPSVKDSFINVNQNEFLYAISSLIDIAINNCKSAPRPMINIRFTQESSKAVIEVVDNGQNSANCFPNKEYQNSLQKIRDILSLHDGTLNFLKNAENSKIILTFPFVEQPKWISTKINLPKDSVVVVLDNDSDANKQWEKLFKTHLDRMKLKVLNCDSKSTTDFIRSISSHEKKNVYAFINYESTYSDSEDILDIMMQRDLMENSVIMTSAYDNYRLQEIVATSGAKILPKQFLKGINIALQ